MTQSLPYKQVKKPHLDFASIELLIEQKVGCIVLTQLYKNLGMSITTTPFPGKRAQYVANMGMNDGEVMRIFSYGGDALNTVRVPTPYYYLETMPFVLEDSGISILAKEDLAPYRLTKIRGVKHTDKITEGLPSSYEMTTTEEMFTLLANKKVDVVLTNTIDGYLALERLKLNNIVSMKQPLARLPLYHYLNKKHRELVPLIDSEIKRTKESGELDQLILLAELQILALNKQLLVIKE